MAPEGGMSGRGITLTAIIFILGFFGVTSDTSPGTELFFIVLTFIGIVIVYKDYRWLE